MITIEYAIKLTGGVSTRGAFILSGNASTKRAFSLVGNVISNAVTRESEYDFYDGPYEVTPTKSTQRLITMDLILEQNVTINSIPDLYIDTTLPNGATSERILTGYSAYANGNLITGAGVLATARVVDSVLILTDGFPVEVA